MSDEMTRALEYLNAWLGVARAQAAEEKRSRGLMPVDMLPPGVNVVIYTSLDTLEEVALVFGKAVSIARIAVEETCQRKCTEWISRPEAWCIICRMQRCCD